MSTFRAHIGETWERDRSRRRVSGMDVRTVMYELYRPLGLTGWIYIKNGECQRETWARWERKARKVQTQ